MSQNKLPLVSIIIINWNGGSVFKDCLTSLSQITYPNWELVVVDNGSTDESLSFAKNFSLAKVKVQILENKTNVGFAPANNQGFEVSRGEYVLLLNNDTKVEKDFLTKMVAKMESDPTIGVMQPKIYMMDKPEYLDNAGSFFTKTGFLIHWGFGKKDATEFDQEREVFTVKGACMLVRRELITKVGLFDPDFVSYFEETDFCWRVWLVGFRCIYFPGTHIYHKVGFTSQRLEVISVNYHSLKNRIVSLIKNLNGFNLIGVMFQHMAILIGLTFYYLIKFQFRQAKMFIDAIVWNIGHLSSTFVKRRKIQKLRKVSDKYIFDKVCQKFEIVEMFKHFSHVEKNLQK